MLFTNNELASLSLDELTSHEKMVKYLKWKEKHLGPHKHRMSNEVKKWKKTHR